MPIWERRKSVGHRRFVRDCLFLDGSHTNARSNIMATKKVTAVIKLQCPAGAATPAPPIGPALGPHGVSAPKFVQEFNARTAKMEKGLIIPVVLTVYQDKSYTFILKTPPAAVLIAKAAGIKKGSGNPLRDKVGKLSAKALEEIAKQKLPDLNANDLEAAKKIIAGTARSMGVEVEGK
jgi:large subunit ribosomal protein L11